MTLTRGSNALFPCPVCYIPNEMRDKGGLYWPRRDVDEIRSIVLNSELSAALKEEMLKNLGVRDVPVRQISLHFENIMFTTFALERILGFSDHQCLSDSFLRQAACE